MMMTQTQEHNVPALRFSEFSGEWKTKKLGELCEFTQGVQIPMSEQLRHNQEGRIRYLYIRDFFTDDFPYYVEDIYPNKIIKKDEIMIVNTGNTAGKAFKGKRGVLSNNSFKISFSKKFLNSDFLFTTLTSNKTQCQIKSFFNAGGQPHLGHKNIALVTMGVSSIDEQQKIASFLTSVDTKIEQLGKKKALLEQYKKGMMQKLFSQSLRFKDEQGNDFPDWEEKRLGDIAKSPSYGMNAAAIPFDGTHKYIRITDIDAVSRKFKPSPLTSPAGEIEAEYKLEEGDILFARTGASTGRSYIYHAKDGQVYFAGFLIRFRISKALPEFIFFSTLLHDFEKWVAKMSMRSGQPGINAKEFSTYPIVFPCFDEQQKIANFLSALDQKIDLITTELKQAQTFKKGLLQQMFV